MAHSLQKEFVPLSIAVLTVSDTRTEEDDTSGQSLAKAARDAGHKVVDKRIVVDDVYQLRAVLSQWIASANVQVVLSTGGTGFTSRDNTPEAFLPLFDKHVEGFGELFRHVSLEEIGSSTMQSRAFAGMANGTLVVCMPGSTGACRTGWGVIKEQLDARHRPCNFVPQLKTAATEQCETRG